MPAGFYFEHPSKASTLAVVVGRLSAVTAPTLLSFRGILWVVEQEGQGTWPEGVPEPVARVGLAEGAFSAVAAALESFVARDVRSLPAVLISDAAAAAPLCAEALAEITAVFRSVGATRMTRQLDGYAWQKHVLHNMADYIRHRLPDFWEGALAGLPAVICGAGPSLDVSASFLKKVHHEVVVFSADSALRALSRQGVAVDFGVSIDVAKVPEQCLAGVTSPPLWMVLSSLSPPEWAQVSAVGRRLFCSSLQVTVDWLRGQGVARSGVLAEENCGVTALALARFLGCGPIYLLGMDQALDEKNQQRRHHEGVSAELYAASGFNPDISFPRVPGNYARTVPTHLGADLQALNASLSEWPEGLVYNVTDRGARLSNTTLVAPQHWRVASQGPPKAGRIGALKISVEPEANVALVLARVRSVAEARLPEVEALVAVAAQRDPVQIRNAFCALFKNQAFARLLGAFALKVMPHLFPPLEEEPVFWLQLVEECQSLTRLMTKV